MNTVNNLYHLSPKNELLTEINRMRKIMELPIVSMSPNTLLNESSGPFDDIATSAADLIIRMLRGSNGTEFTVAGKVYQRNTMEALSEVLEDVGNRLATADKSVKKLLGSLIQEDETLSRKFYISWLESRKKYNSQTETDILQLIKERMNSKNQSFDTALKSIIGKNESSDIIFEAIRKEIDARYVSYNNNPSEFLPLDSAITPKKLSTRQMKKLRRAVNKKTPKLFIFDWIRGWKKSIDEIKLEIESLNAGYIQQVAEKRLAKDFKPEQINELTEAYAAEITRKMNQLEIKKNGAAADVLSDAGLSSDITSMIRKGEIDFFRIFRETWEKEGESVGVILRDVGEQFVDDIKVTLQDLFTKGSRWDAFKRLIDPKTSVGQWVYTSQFASLNKQYLALIRTSAGESLSTAGKYSLVYFAQTFSGYLIGWFMSTIVFFLFDIFLGLVQGGYNWVVSKSADIFDLDDEWVQKNTLSWDLWLNEGNGAKFIWERLSELFKFLESPSKGEKYGILDEVLNMIQKFVVGGLGTIQESVGFSVVNKILEAASSGKRSIEDFDGFIIEAIDALKSLLGVAKVTVYTESKEGFKKYVQDELDLDEFTLSSIEEIEYEGKKYYKIERRGNTAESYYIYNEDKNTFEIAS